MSRQFPRAILAMVPLLLSGLAALPTAGAMSEDPLVPPCTLNDDHWSCWGNACQGAVDTDCWFWGGSAFGEHCDLWVAAACVVGGGGGRLGGWCTLWVVAVCVIGDPQGSCDLWPIERDC